MRTAPALVWRCCPCSGASAGAPAAGNRGLGRDQPRGRRHPPPPRSDRGWTLRFDAIHSDSIRSARFGKLLIIGQGQGTVGFLKQLRGGPSELFESEVTFSDADTSFDGVQLLGAMNLTARFSYPRHYRDQAPGLAVEAAACPARGGCPQPGPAHGHPCHNAEDLQRTSARKAAGRTPSDRWAVAARRPCTLAGAPLSGRWRPGSRPVGPAAQRSQRPAPAGAPPSGSEVDAALPRASPYRRGECVHLPQLDRPVRRKRG